MAAFTKYDHSTGSYKAVPGTEDFIEVDVADTGGYSWSAFGVYFSPSARRYFWLSDSGCSCYSYGEYVASIEDFENGSREDALRAAKAEVTVPTKEDRWGDYFTQDQRDRILAAIRNFDEAAAAKEATK
ncbi:hypothetical protein SEA_GARDENSTATE_24 [Microbacterium phage GardenState]|uniref:DUF7574 domain-containing protein n=2 Tax=Gardenstatevirus TaxID=3425012 RepID=A0A4Y6E710_9CAUD|nr:hypothetical protein SEA_IAMGROOT_24 [Microbacterium phage IAmGroot]QOI66936.1 hypothetical protein SEA_GARDENSTATE_24 [Microbacterium phage GardenState]